MTDYMRAVDIRAPKKLVYAEHVEHVPGEPANFSIIEFPDGPEVVEHGKWVVWFDEDDGPYYIILSDERFRDRYLVGDDIPESIRAEVEARESFEEWCSRLNAEGV